MLWIESMALSWIFTLSWLASMRIVMKLLTRFCLDRKCHDKISDFPPWCGSKYRINKHHLRSSLPLNTTSEFKQIYTHTLVLCLVLFLTSPKTSTLKQAHSMDSCWPIRKSCSIWKSVHSNAKVAPRFWKWGGGHRCSLHFCNYNLLFRHNRRNEILTNLFSLE